MPARSLSPTRLLFVCCGLLLFSSLVGCDTLEVGGEEIILPNPVEVSFEFMRDVDNSLSAGSTLELASEGSASVDGRLGGFARDEIVRARLTGAQLTRGFPQRNLSELIQGAELRLSASGLPAVTVATLETPPSAATAQLQPTSQAANVGTYLAQPSFTATLVLTTQSLEPDTYDFEVELAFEVTLSGL